MNAQELRSAVTRWATGQADVRAVVLVGSHARGDARPDSDIDLVILCTDPAKYLRALTWLSTFGAVQSTEIEDWGEVQSVRAFYSDGLEVEFGLTSDDWATCSLDTGTLEVLAGGAMILLDRDGRLAQAIESLPQSR